MELPTFWREYLLPRIDRLDLFRRHNPKHTTSAGRGRIVMDCPNCGQPKEAWIYDDRSTIKCNRQNSCGYNADIVHYLNGGDWPSGEKYKAFIRLWSENLNMPVPQRATWTPEQAAKLEAEKTREQALEKFLSKCHLDLFNHQAAYDYLTTTRGFDREDLARFELGYLTTTEPGLFTTENIDEAMAARMWNGRVVGPVRDKHGRLRGLTGRALDDRQPKYMYTPNLPLQEMGGIGWDSVGRVKDIIGVEGYFDALGLKKCGINGVISIGGSGHSCTPDYYRHLGNSGISTVTWLFDNDKTGQDGLYVAVCNSREVPAGPEPYVIDPRNLADCKDVDAYRIQYGIEAVAPLLAQRIHGFRYAARALARDVDFSSDTGLGNYARSCVQFDEGITHPRQSFWSRQYFLPEVQHISGADLDFLIEWRDTTRQEEVKRQQEKLLLAGIRDAQEALREGEYLRARELVTEGLETSLQASLTVPPKPIVSLDQELEEHRRYILANLGKRYFGLIQKTMPLVDDALLGFQEICLVSGKSGEGKTALCLQFAVDVLQNHNDTSVLIVGKDTKRRPLRTRMLCNLSGLTYEELRTGTAEGGGHTEEERERFDRAYLKLQDMAPRIVMLGDDNFGAITRQAIIKQAARTKDQHGTSRCLVVIDYLELLHISEEKRRARVDPDEYQIEQVRGIADAMPDDAILCITMARKDGASENANDNFRGSVVKIHRSDSTIYLRPYTNDEIITTYTEICPGMVGTRASPPDKGDLKDIKLAKKLRELLSKEGKQPGYLIVGKAREGGHKAEIPVIHYFHRCQFRQGT